MTEREWGPWIDHDGHGCPISLIGHVVLLEIKLAADDEDGGRVGEHHFNETIVNEFVASLPEWWREKFGGYAIRPDNGKIYAVADVVRYRIRKPRGMMIIQDLLADLPETVDA